MSLSVRVYGSVCVYGCVSACPSICLMAGYITIGFITAGTVEELQNEVQLLNNRIDEMSKKTVELNQEKDEIEKVSEH